MPVRASLFLTVLLAFASVALPVFGQGVPTVEEPEELHETGRALSFSFDGFDLDELHGGIGGKLWVGPLTALRGALGLTLSSGETTVTDVSEGSRSAYGADLTLVLERHMRGFRRISPYFGLGGQAGYASSTETQEFQPGAAVLDNRTEETTLSFNVVGSLGVEFFATRRISLAAEHMLRAGVAFVDERSEYRPIDGATVVNESDETNFVAGSQTSRLILSMYF